jgi:hypothetical protein
LIIAALLFWAAGYRQRRYVHIQNEVNLTNNNLKIDFQSDWLQFLKNELVELGYISQPNETSRDLCLKYLNLLRRLIAPLPREVLKANEFSCPQNLEEGLKSVEEKIINGIDLKPHLSRQITNINYNDGLLNDWGIYHLHLGTTIEANGFVTRTGPVLFARFDNEKAYFINVMPHGSWTKQEMVKVVHNNWPESIERYKMKGIYGVGHKVTDDEIKILRDRVNIAIEVEQGVVYAPIGGGSATSGTSIQVVMDCDNCTWMIRDAEKYVKENINDFATFIEKETGVKPTEFDFKLQIYRDKWIAYEKISKYAFLIYNLT